MQALVDEIGKIHFQHQAVRTRQSGAGGDGLAAGDGRAGLSIRIGSGKHQVLDLNARRGGPKRDREAADVRAAVPLRFKLPNEGLSGEDACEPGFQHQPAGDTAHGEQGGKTQDDPLQLLHAKPRIRMCALLSQRKLMI